MPGSNRRRGYVAPDIYTGNATLSPIASKVNDTHFALQYLCQNCWAWNQDGATGSQPPSAGVEVLGWVQSNVSPDDPSDPDSTIVQHDNGMGEWGAAVASARNSQYSTWASSATPTTTAPGGGGSSTPTACTGTTAPTATYDYIVVGAGAGGIPLADKLSESGKSVLLIEKGPPSSGRWGGTMKPDWLDGTNLTRFDVPGLCNEIWVDSAGIACTGIDQMAGCVLGGGTAVNAALWWRAPDIDWDYNFPTGWKSTNMASAVNRVFSRIPGTDHPSADGKLYLQQGFDVVSGALAKAGWKSVVANNVPNQKDKVYSHTPYMFSHGERGGPMATYLVTASARKNFDLWMNTGVRRLVRNGGHVTGVEVEGTTADGYCGTVNVTATSGRVILSAGVFGTAKILFRSGIGPEDQLSVVNASSADSGTMIDEDEWIILPVGENLDDHTDVSTTRCTATALSNLPTDGPGHPSPQCHFLRLLRGI
jgi:cellobiose dehydrogenase (acceptor)